jgi:MtfA peptidase
MLVTPEQNRRNQSQALVTASCLALLTALAGWFFPALWGGLILCPLAWWLIRRRCLRRLRAMNKPFPAAWEDILQGHVRFFQALADCDKDRFRQMVKVFLDEIRITGVRTDVDETIRVLVAASAIIPVFGFQDWNYSRLGEVLIYPAAFDRDYRTQGAPDANTLGMVGLAHLSGVMILSKPSLLEGFDNPAGSDHVGIHEFAHLVENEQGRSGLPPEVPWPVVKEWLQFVGRELRQPSDEHAHINPYAYTNDHEFFAVLAEYFFKSPEVLKRKDPKLYEMLRALFHQDPASLLSGLSRQGHRYADKAPCPCGGGRKFRDCCKKGAPDSQKVSLPGTP